jgi:hypothetical protein
MNKITIQICEFSSFLSFLPWLNPGKANDSHTHHYSTKAIGTHILANFNFDLRLRPLMTSR